MREKKFFMGIALAALASCSSEDVVEVNSGNQIDFRAAMGLEAEARSAETTSANLSEFYASAFIGSSPYFKDVLFSKGADGVFTSTPTFYWPGQKAVGFFAYSHYADGLTGVATATAMEITGFSPNTDIAAQHDIVGAYATGTNETTNLALPFKHLLSQIRIEAKSSMTNYKFDVVGVQIGNVAPTGKFTWTHSGTDTGVEKLEWTQQTGSQDYTDDFPEGKVVTLGTEAVDIMNMLKADAPEGDVNIGNAGAMLIPQQLVAWKPTDKNIENGAYLAVKLRIYMTDTNTQIYPDAAGEYAYAYVPIDTKWEPENCYIYTLDFSAGAGYDEKGDPILGGPITFTTTVSGWTNPTNKDVTLN